MLTIFLLFILYDNYTCFHEIKYLLTFLNETTTYILMNTLFLLFRKKLWKVSTPNWLLL